MSPTAPQLLARDTLRDLYLFRDLSDAQYAALRMRSRTLRPAHDTWVAAQGEPAEAFYCVVEGRIALTRQGDDGQEKVVAVLGAGETFGEAAACDRAPLHAVGARAVGPAVVVAFDLALLRRLLTHSASLCLEVMRVMQQREQFLLGEIDRLALQSASQRLVAWLLAKADGRAERVHLDIPKALLASHLSITPETFSRLLGRLRDQELVRDEGDGSLVILDPLRLQSEYRCMLCGGRSWGCPGPTYA